MHELHLAFSHHLVAPDLASLWLGVIIPNSSAARQGVQHMFSELHPFGAAASRVQSGRTSACIILNARSDGMLNSSLLRAFLRGHYKVLLQ